MPIDVGRIKAICFDVDGTLSDTDDQFVQRLVGLFSPIDFIFPNRDVLPLARKIVMMTEGPGNWFFGLADRFNFDDKIVALGDWFYERGIGEVANPYTLIDGVRELLTELRNQYPLSIISARGQKSTFRFLFQFELLPHFTAVATGQTCHHTKPHPEPVLWAAEKMGVHPTECLMVGDTVFDILAGKNAGAQTVGVLCGFGEENEIRKAEPDLVINNTADLLGYFTKP